MPIYKFFLFGNITGFLVEASGQNKKKSTWNQLTSIFSAPVPTVFDGFKRLVMEVEVRGSTTRRCGDRLVLCVIMLVMGVEVKASGVRHFDQ